MGTATTGIYTYRHPLALQDVLPIWKLSQLAPIALILLASVGARAGDSAAGGSTAVRTAGPAVGVPAGTGDITLFNPVTSRDASALDVSAVMTNVRSTCADATADVVTTITFDVFAQRRDTSAARDVTDRKSTRLNSSH